MEHNPLIQLTALFESRGYVGREAVEEAEFELAQRQRERELHSKLYRVDGTTLLSLVPALFSTVVIQLLFVRHLLDQTKRTLPWNPSRSSCKKESANAR
jgi:hypothetical protein